MESVIARAGKGHRRLSSHVGPYWPAAELDGVVGAALQALTAHDAIRRAGVVCWMQSRGYVLHAWQAGRTRARRRLPVQTRG